jgi:predicted porin
MQKKIIALAVAGLMSGAAFAQSNVTIYGVMDIGYLNQRASNPGAADGKVNGMNTGGLSGSRLGFKGTEDLGNGMKAVWVYELGTLTPDTATNNIGATRQSYLGLATNYGTFVGGRIQTPGYAFGAKFDAHGASIFSPVNQMTDNAALSISTRDPLGTQDNTFAYISPTFGGGFSVVAAYSFGTGGELVDVGAAGTDPQNIWALGVNYDMGPLSVGYVHHDVNDLGNTSGTDQTEDAIGVNYDFGMVKLFGSYQRGKTKTTAGGTVRSDRIWNIGARAPIGNGSVGIAYANYRDKEVTPDAKSSSWGVDYQYSLSKRTTAYVGYSQMSNNRANAFGLLNHVNAGSPAVVANGKERQYAVGLRHTF